MSRLIIFVSEGLGLLCLCCLIDWFSASVPKINDVDGVTVDAIDHLAQPIDDYAVVGFWTIGIEWVDWANVWLTCH